MNHDIKIALVVVAAMLVTGAAVFGYLTRIIRAATKAAEKREKLRAGLHRGLYQVDVYYFNSKFISRCSDVICHGEINGSFVVTCDDGTIVYYPKKEVKQIVATPIMQTEPEEEYDGDLIHVRHHRQGEFYIPALEIEYSEK